MKKDLFPPTDQVLGRSLVQRLRHPSYWGSTHHSVSALSSSHALNSSSLYPLALLCHGRTTCLLQPVPSLSPMAQLTGPPSMTSSPTFRASPAQLLPPSDLCHGSASSIHKPCMDVVLQGSHEMMASYNRRLTELHPIQ